MVLARNPIGDPSGSCVGMMLSPGAMMGLPQSLGLAIGERGQQKKPPPNSGKKQAPITASIRPRLPDMGRVTKESVHPLKSDRNVSGILRISYYIAAAR
jgi:hypothetical protein